MKKIIIVLVVFMTTFFAFADEQREMRVLIFGKMPTSNPKLYVIADATFYNIVKSINNGITFGLLYVPAKWFDVKVSAGFQTLKKVLELNAFPKLTFGKFIWRSRITVNTDKDLQFESFALAQITKDFSVGIETDRIGFGPVGSEEKIRAFGPHFALTMSKNLIVAVTVFVTHRGPVTRGYVTILF